MIELFTWNLYNLVYQHHPNIYNKKWALKKYNKNWGETQTEGIFLSLNLYPVVVKDKEWVSNISI